ncbi:MAG: membrane protein insertion efficiency factor YidD [Patescibacteria group bacterium]|jgi:hypothetical protein|nr:membrane protein insertion efficiency factor YidD [Patescibacteria group bacterium]
MYEVVRHLPKIVSLQLIRIYQQTFSPDHGWFSPLHPLGRCKFKPTCSEYAYQAIDKYGFLKGWLKASWRLLRCNPFSKGGYDPLK